MSRMDQIEGQSQAVDVLQAALRTGRIHHAFVFGGPEGVGKFTTAIAFAQLLLCHDRGQDLAGMTIACGACASCQFFRDSSGNDDGNGGGNGGEGGRTGESHPDLHVVRKEMAKFSDSRKLRERKQLNIPLDLLREMVVGGQAGTGKYHSPTVANSAALGHGKVFIIDEAELLAVEGQNALLKTLEEPPSQTRVILVTSLEDRLLPTIRSRCQRVVFVPLSETMLDRFLDREAAGRDDLKLSESDRGWLLQFAAGSMGRLRFALQYNLVSWSQFVLPALNAMAGGRAAPSLGRDMAGAIDALAKQWVSDHDNASKEAANRMAADLMWSLIAQEARLRIHREAASLAADSPEDNEARLEPWLGVIDAIRRGEADLRSNVNLGLTADHVAMLIDRALRGRQSAGVR